MPALRVFESTAESPATANTCSQNRRKCSAGHEADFTRLLKEGIHLASVQSLLDILHAHLLGGARRHVNHL